MTRRVRDADDRRALQGHVLGNKGRMIWPAKHAKGRENKTCMPEKGTENKGSPGRKPNWRFSAGYFLFMMTMLLLWQAVFTRLPVQKIPYSDFQGALERGEG